MTPETVPPLVSVTSSNLAAIGYDPDTETLYVAFGRPPAALTLYAYDNVPPAVHAALMAAPSHGTYLNAVIKADPARYPYRKLDGVPFELAVEREAA